MRSEAHIVIVGAGMIGLSCAYWLSKLGAEDIVVVDRNSEVALGSSSKCAGVITTNFSDKVLLNLARESVKLFRQLPCDIQTNGQIVLYSDPEEIEEEKKKIE